MCGPGGPGGSGGSGVPGSAASAASGTPGSAVAPGATTGVGGSIPGGIGLGIGTGGMSMSTGPGVPGAGQGSGTSSAAALASMGPITQGTGGWGSSDWGQAISGIMTGIGMLTANPALLAATIVPDFLGMLPDMNISRPVPQESAETIALQSGGTGEQAALPSLSTPAPTPAPAPAETPTPAVDNTAYNKTLMDQYIASILNMPSGGGRGIRGSGLPGYRQENQKTADEWLSKYWRD